MKLEPSIRLWCNIAPAIAGDANQPSVWPSLREKAFGPNLLQLDTEVGCWTFFIYAGCLFAMALVSGIGRMKGLYHQACQDAGQEQGPEHAVLGAPDRILFWHWSKEATQPVLRRHPS